MTKKLWLVVLFSFMTVAASADAPPVPTAGDGLTLRECYALALKRSETIAIQKEYVKETEGQLLQAFSAALPRVAFAYSEKWQDITHNNTFGGASPEGKFTFTQPLFSGFMEFAAIAATRHLGKQRQLELKRARELLFTDVADAFYLYASYQDSLDVLELTHKALLDRVDELKRREAIGRSRSSEVASALAKLYSNEAAMEGVRGQKSLTGELVEFLIGRTFEKLSPEDLPSKDVPAEELYPKAAARADVQAARENLELFRNNVTVMRAQFFPTVTLSGNSYTKRLDANEGNDWDATLAVNVPLFNGLNDFGQVNQARAQFHEADFQLSRATRQALLEIRNAYTRLLSARERFKALDRAVDGYEKNYELQAQDFQKSLVSNLDVLQAIQDLQGARSDRVTGKTDEQRAYWNLKVATGEVEL